jgi:predicted ATPase
MASQKEIISSFKKVKELNYGVKLFKADLHFHTPASQDARGKNRYNFNPYKTKYPKNKGDFKEYDLKVRKKQEKILIDARKVAKNIVARFSGEKLGLVAVTDHNGIGTIWPDNESAKGVMDLAAPTWYELIDDAAQELNKKVGKRILTILPGVEISTNGIHMLAIFPPEQPRRKVHFMICDMLNEVGFAIDDWGKNPKVGKTSPFNTIALICKKGGIPIPAHIDGSDQALLRLFKLKSGAMKDVLKNKHLLAVEVVKPSRFMKKDKKLRNTVKNWIDKERKRVDLSPLAYFQGSDAHDLKNISKRFTYLKMTEPSFSGLRSGINAPSSRVRLSQLHKPVVKGLYIYGIEIKNKFFGKRYIRFNRHMNCILGKKGAGKTELNNLMQKSVKPETADVKGDVKLFIEKISNSKSSTYAFCRSKNKDSIALYSVNTDKMSLGEMDFSKAKGLKILPGFYKPDGINKIISSKSNLNDFLIKHFGNPISKNMGNFNKIFDIPSFLETKNDRLFKVEIVEGAYKLYLNLNWGIGKEKLADFSSLAGSLKHASLICMIIISGGFGPIIIDSPENHIDKEDLVNLLVPIIKKYKDFRQIILFTKSPILAVNADPENYVLLNLKGKKLKNITVGFSIDKKDQRGDVADLLEGSEKAFKKRGIRYEI